MKINHRAKPFLVWKEVWVGSPPVIPSKQLRLWVWVIASLNLMLFLLQDFQIQSPKKEMKMSKAQSDALTESRKLLGVGSEGFIRQKKEREEEREEWKHRFKATLWAPSACGLCRSLAPILSSAQFLRSRDPPGLGTLHCKFCRRAVTWQVEHAWKVSLLWGEKLRNLSNDTLDTTK